MNERGELIWPSEIDERFAVPGDVRPDLAAALATEAASTIDAHFQTETWERIHELDRSEGFATRAAVRGVLHRPSDGRFLVFRYPFRDGTRRFVLPGGGAEPGEDPIGTLCREVLEETGTEPRDLEHTGMVLFHLLASTIHGEGRTPTIQYSPVLTGTIDDELPDTGGREALWFTIEEFEAQPRRPISDPLIAVLRARQRGEQLEPQAIWLPA